MEKLCNYFCISANVCLDPWCIAWCGHVTWVWSRYYWPRRLLCCLGVLLHRWISPLSCVNTDFWKHLTTIKSKLGPRCVCSRVPCYNCAGSTATVHTSDDRDPEISCAVNHGDKQRVRVWPPGRWGRSVGWVDREQTNCVGAMWCVLFNCFWCLWQEESSSWEGSPPWPGCATSSSVVKIG